MRLFEVLLERTGIHAGAGVPIEKIHFQAAELSEGISEITGNDAAEPARQVRDLWARLDAELEGAADLLAEIARETGGGWVPALGKSTSAGGRNRPSYYRLEAREAAVDGLPAHVDTEPPPGGVLYRIQSLRRPPRYLKWLDGLELLRGWGRLLFTVMLLGIVWEVAVVWFALWALVRLDVRLLPLLIVAAILIYLPWILLGPFYSAMYHRVATAPDWWFGLRDNDHQLQYARTRQSSASGPGERRLHLVSYEATCSRCGGRVAVAGGGFRWWGRLVGRCREAPREHVFSFDHVTRVGQRLR